MIGGSLTGAALAGAAAVAGLMLGLLYFAILRRAVDVYVRGDHLPAAVLTLGRLIGAISLFVLAAKLGPLPLLASLIGFLAARVIAVRTPRSMP